MTLIKLVFENKDLIRIIASYVVIPKYDLLDWVDKMFKLKIPNSKHEDEQYLECMNNYQESYDYLIKDYEKINWKYLSRNIYAIEFLENNLDKIDWTELSSNCNAVHILEKNIDKIDWNTIGLNINAGNIIKNNIDKIKDLNLLGNYEYNIELINKYFEKIDFINIVANRNAIYLEKYQDYIQKNLDFFGGECNRNRGEISFIKMMFFNNKNIFNKTKVVKISKKYELLNKDYETLKKLEELKCINFAKYLGFFSCKDDINNYNLEKPCPKYFCIFLRV